MKQTVYLNKAQCIELAGMAATSDMQLVGVSQSVIEGVPEALGVALVTTAHEGQQKAFILTALGDKEELTDA